MGAKDGGGWLGGWGGLGGLGFGAGAALDRGSVAGGELGGDLGLEAEGVAACFADFPGQLVGELMGAGTETSKVKTDPLQRESARLLAWFGRGAVGALFFFCCSPVVGRFPFPALSVSVENDTLIWCVQ